jgi:hypothetical protein
MRTKTRSRTVSKVAHASKIGKKRVRRAKMAATATVIGSKTAVHKKIVIRKKAAKATLVRRLARQIERGLEGASVETVEKVVVLFERAPSVGRQIVREAVAAAAERAAAEHVAARTGEPMAASAVEALRGEGLRVAGTEEERRRIAAALERARRRGEESVGEILSRPEMLPGEVFAERANTSRETVNRWRNEGRILGLEGNARGVRYPEWQLDRGLVLKDLPAFLKAVRDPWIAYRVLTSPWPEFEGMTGLEALRGGRAAELVGVVRGFGETY